MKMRWCGKRKGITGRGGVKKGYPRGYGGVLLGKWSVNQGSNKEVPTLGGRKLSTHGCQIIL